MLISERKIYIHNTNKRRVAIINLDSSKVKIRYIQSGHSSFYYFRDFAKSFTILE